MRATRMVPKNIIHTHVLMVSSLIPKMYNTAKAKAVQMAKLIRVMILRLKIVLEICRNFFIVVLLIGLWCSRSAAERPISTLEHHDTNSDTGRISRKPDYIGLRNGAYAHGSYPTGAAGHLPLSVRLLLTSTDTMRLLSRGAG